MSYSRRSSSCVVTPAIASLLLQAGATPVWATLVELNLPTPGMTTGDQDDVLFAEVSLGDGAWTLDDLVSFSIQFEVLADDDDEEEPEPVVTVLTYEMESITMASAVLHPILNHDFQLHVWHRQRQRSGLRVLAPGDDADTHGNTRAKHSCTYFNSPASPNQRTVGGKI